MSASCFGKKGLLLKLTILRLILYYPVSALVTLFANILQNPSDARARSDVKLMNVVVNFLSTLVSDESNGSIKRMLGLCGEFERIAKVVLDKAEKESYSKKKRKSPEEPVNLQQSTPEEHPAPSPSTTQPTQAPSRNVPMSSPLFAENPGDPGGNTMADDAGGFASSREIPGTTSVSTNIPPNIQAMPGIAQDYQDMLSPDPLEGVSFADQPPYSATANTPLSSFQQPFVPQDLWQMPMTIEWDWADMSTNFPVFDTNGPPHGGL